MLNLGQVDNVPQEHQETPLYYWARLLTAKTWEEVRTLAEQKDYLAETALELYHLSDDEKIRLQCEARERYEKDISCIRAAGYNEGHTAGFSEGHQFGAHETTTLINQLNLFLTQDNRNTDLFRSFSDPDFQKKLLVEYGLIAAKE